MKVIAGSFGVVMLLLSVFCVTASAGERIRNIEVFTDSKTSIEKKGYVEKATKVKVKVHVLDRIEIIEDTMNKGLPTNEKQAMKEVERRMNRQDKRKHLEEAMAALQGIVVAYKYKLTHIPAVVINNGEGVVYGVRDLKVAMNHYNEWKKRR